MVIGRTGPGLEGGTTRRDAEAQGGVPYSFPSPPSLPLPPSPTPRPRSQRPRSGRQGWERACDCVQGGGQRVRRGVGSGELGKIRKACAGNAQR